jgi:hypothetical protein
MPTINSAFIDGLLSTPLVLPAPVAGALAALFFVMVVMAIRRAARGSGSRVIISLFVTVIAAIAVIGLLDRLAISERSSAQRALQERDQQLDLTAASPGSAVACLDGLAGEEIENACEKAVFADPQSTARAVAYTAARLSLLADAVSVAKQGGPDLQPAFAKTRRAIELDRYGIAAHVLVARDGCTVDRCAAFSMLQDATTLRSNMKVHAFDTYVARYAAGWEKNEPEREKQPQVSSTATDPVASVPEPPSPAHPLDSRYDFPSAASIPPVSIMNAEPPPKPAAPPSTAAGTEKLAAPNPPPVPPKRPQAQAASPPAR